mgnify:CR=1 FL=1
MLKFSVDKGLRVAYEPLLDPNGKSVYVGNISGNNYQDACFTYADTYLENQENRAISIGLPLEEKTFDAARTRIFFEGLLPEGFTRRCVAEWMHMELDYDYSNYVSYGDSTSNKLKIIITVTTLDTEGEVKTKKTTVTIKETNGGATINDFIFGFRNNHDQSYYDNFSVEYEVKPGEFALWSHIGENNGVAETNQFISYTGDAHGTNRYIKSAEMNIGTSSLSVSDGTEMRVIYAYQDAKNYHYFAYSFDGNKGIYGRLRQVADGVDSAEDLSVFYAAPALSNGGLTKFSDGVGVKDNYTVTLEYLTNRKAKITFVNKIT